MDSKNKKRHLHRKRTNDVVGWCGSKMQ